MSRMWMLSFSPGLTTMAFMIDCSVHLKSVSLNAGRHRVRFAPVVVPMALEAARFRPF